MRKVSNRLAIVGTLLTLVFIVSGSSVMALRVNPSTPAANSNASGSNNVSTTAKANKQQQITATQLRVCTNRQNAITNIMNHIVTRTQNQLQLFGTIANSVENFSNTSGKVVPNYTQLVASINSAQTQATTDLTTLKANAVFNCTGLNPRGMISSFQGYVKVEINDLQTYRMTVKNLIVAVAKANNVTITNQQNSGN
jgi:hypothetical protein